MDDFQSSSGDFYAARSYPQSESLPKGSGDASQASALSQPEQASTWNFTDIDSRLLQFLYFLAEHDVEAVDRDDLSVGDKLGQGNSMEVFRGKWKERPVILKYPRKDMMPQLGKGKESTNTYNEQLALYRRLQKELLFEIQVMARRPLNEHRNVTKLLAVSFEDILITPESGSAEVRSQEEIFIPILIVEPAIEKHPTIESYFEVNSDHDISVEMASSLISDIADGLTAIHLYGIVHGDVKDANILLFEEEVDGERRIIAKIADFGFSGIEPSRQDIRGRSPYWAAPEVLERLSGWEGRRLTPAADIYSFGLLAASIAMNGKRPFAEDADHEILKQKDKAGTHIEQRLKRYNETLLGPLNEAMDNFLKGMCAILHNTVRFKPTDRWKTLSTVRQLLQNRTDEGYLELANKMVPYHSYGSEAYPGVKAVAPKVAEEIYPKLPISLKHRLAFHVQHFEEASLDSQSLLVFLAQAMREDPTVLDGSKDLVRLLAAVRLLQPSPPPIPVLPEADMNDLGGFFPMFLKEVIVNGKPEPPLLKAVREEDVVKAKEILRESPELRRTTIDKGWNGLHYAAHFDRPEIMPLFLDEPNPVDINATGGTVHRYTPLHEAVLRANPACVKQLLALGAAVDPQSMNAGELNLTPLHLLITQWNPAKESESLAITRMLLAAGASTNFRTRGLGIAHNAAQKNTPLLDILLDHDPSLINQLTPNAQTPLHSATGRRNLPAVKLLLSRHAPVDARNIVRDTPLHNAYMSLGPATNPKSSRYDEWFANNLCGSEEDAKEIIRVLVEAGADEEALGLENVPWDTPEFRMYDEYEDASSLRVSFGKEVREQKGKEGWGEGWEVVDWSGSEFSSCALFKSPGTRLSIYLDLRDLTPNYYQFSVRCGMLKSAISSFSLTFLVYRCPQPDTAEIVMVSRLPLRQFNPNTTYSVKLRGIVVKHRGDFHVHVYSEVGPKDIPTGQTEGTLMLDWIKVEKYNIFVDDGASSLEEMVGLEEVLEELK